MTKPLMNQEKVEGWRRRMLEKLLPPAVRAKAALKRQKATRQRQLAYLKARRQEDPIYAETIRVRNLVSGAFKRSGMRKPARTEAILGCSLQFFRGHIELQFQRGMTWANRHLWHIDHITPLATAKTEADVIALNHFTNLRPLWALDNLAKSDTVTHLI